MKAMHTAIRLNPGILFLSPTLLRALPRWPASRLPAFVAHAAADCYTILATATAPAINETLTKNVVRSVGRTGLEIGQDRRRRAAPLRLRRSVLSLCPDPGSANDLSPFLGFISHQLAELGGRKHQGHPPQFGKPRLYFGVGKAQIDLLVEPVDDLIGRVLCHANANERAHFIAWQEIGQRGNIRQCLRARRIGYRQRSKLTGPDVLDGRRQVVESRLHLPAEQID